jgi:amino acid adenylation domain-containing protein
MTNSGEQPGGRSFGANKRELLKRLLESRAPASQAPAAPRLQSAERRTEVPLSFAQQRLWLLDQLTPASAAYNVPAAIVVNGRLCRSALEQGFGEIVRRHEALRTSFPTVADQPTQAVAGAGPFSLQVVDLCTLPEPDRRLHTRRLVDEEARRPFDLVHGPLMRVTLVRLDEEQHVVLLALHHVICDGWSLGVLTDELSSLYASFSQGEASSVPALTIQYADFSAWQREWLKGEVLESQLAHWKDRLAGAPSSLLLPTDRARPPVQSVRGARQSLAVPESLSAQLKTLSQREGTTLFCTLLAAFATLLYRWTGQHDILIGTPVAGRTRAELERMIGLFVNTLVLRTDLRNNPSFRELMARVHDVALDAWAHQELPFEKLVEEVERQRDLSRTPLFQVMFVLQNTPTAGLTLPGLAVTPFDVSNETAKFDLLLDLTETEQGLEGTLEYKTDLFDASTIARMAAHVETLLEGIVLNPDKPVGELSLLSEVERRQSLVDWNATAIAYPQDSTIVALFEAQVTRTPDAVAIASEEGQLTYADINRRANRLAHHLVASGIGAETAVGVFMPRTIDMVVALLGVLKCGAVYVPLDPDYPTRRLAFLVRDARIAVLLTLERPDGEFFGPGVQVVALEQARSAIASRSSANLTERSRPDSLAYVMYTSGSTGTPKGVGVPHRGVIRLLFGAGYAEFGPHVVVPHLSSPTFDASTFEIWAPLLHGGRCVLHTDRVPSPQDLATAIRTHGLTTMWLTSALFNAVVDEDPGLLCGLDQLLIGGEALSPSHVRLAVAALPTTRVINGYGPTESTTFTCCYPIPHAFREDGRSIPIGRPIGNTQVYVLDGSMQPQPVGVAGDLYVGGAGLARGYFNRPDQTAEVFVPNPFGTATAATRLYRTGDRSRWLSTGAVEFLGRMDHQVKIRGFRIETGEIEAVLGQHPGVREVVVLARADTPGEARLVVYLVAHGGLPDVAELRSYLKASLPGYMVPTAFVTLDALPLTSNGKVDRHALPAPQASYTEETYVAPRNDREKRLVNMFSEVLGIDLVGVHDNFFEIGGHSLLATKIVSRIRADFGEGIPLRRVFEKPTVFELARSLEQGKASGSSPAAFDMPLERTRHEKPLRLSFAQQRLWFLDQMEPGNPYYNMPAALRMSGEVSVVALEKAFGEIVRRHEVLQAGYVLQQGQPVQVRMRYTHLAVRIVDLSSLDEASREAHVRRMAALDASRPFDLSVGDVLRVTLLTGSATSHTILFAMHHIVSDGWSLAVAVREMSVLYAAFCDGRPSPLEELPVQYADFAVSQRKWLESGALKYQLAYWKARLGGHLPTLDIRTDRPRPEIETFRGEDEILFIPDPLAGALNRLSTQEHVTLFMTLVAAYKTLLHRHVGLDDVVVGTDFAGRNRTELEGLIGFFVNLLVLRTDLSGNPTFRDVLARVRETSMGAFAHPDVPFDRLVEELRPKRHRSRTPLFQMLFVMENIPQATLRLPGLTMTLMPSQANTARFDLAVFVREQPGGIATRWTYKTDLFDRSTIQRLANQYLALLENIVASPEARLNELEMRTQAEIQDRAHKEQRRREVRMSSLVPGGRRARNIAPDPGGAGANSSDSEDKVRTP